MKDPASVPHATPRSRWTRLRLQVRGVVQGVGFRPFVYRLADEMKLNGWVNNSPAGVTIEVEGPLQTVNTFRMRLTAEKPPLASIQGMEPVMLEPAGYVSFEIRESQNNTEPTALILPDIATCPDCMADIRDPDNRRYRYPFTNCTNCGPRFSIIRSLPYDRPNTAMAAFPMCPECRTEYDNPLDRRFHAQPNACPVCGPQLQLLDPEGRELATRKNALNRTVQLLRDGRIVAVLGLGGFHLMTDARNGTSVNNLRHRKGRGDKPFALMMPDLNTVRTYCSCSETEAHLLNSPESPIVLLNRLPESREMDSAAPGNPCLGVMLPYTPLHAILMDELWIPLIATSGNLSDEPICITPDEGLERLARIADVFLVHNRPIVRHVDDSIVRIINEREMVLRRARGYAPLPVPAPGVPDGILGIGGQLKNTISFSRRNQVFISQHIGDLETEGSRNTLERTAADLPALYATPLQQIACDMHPDYASTLAAREMTRDTIPVQHHLAHVISCMMENEITAPGLGVAWDGTGYGTDGTVWGGEWFSVQPDRIRRLATCLTFPLPGGETAVREPRRAAAGMLHQLGMDPFCDNALDPMFSETEKRNLPVMIERGINCPRTSSIGRLFDGISALMHLASRNSYEGEAAMKLEFLAMKATRPRAYTLPVTGGPETTILTVDWRPMVRDILTDRDNGIPLPDIAGGFHGALARIVVEIAIRCKLDQVVLSGGCFQNALLLTETVRLLKEAGLRPYWHQRVPTNDGGISLGQIGVAALMQSEENGVIVEV